MTTEPLRLPFLLALAAAIAWPMAAQTAPKSTTTTTAPTHRAAGASATHRTAGGCVTPAPTVSAKIPTLPAAAPCVKTLYTVTRMGLTRVDYVSPLVSEGVREELGGGPSTYSLNYVDTKVGTGDLVEPHKWLTVHYTGYLTDGTKFDSSRDRGQPISFPYGAHQVIPGWDTGFEGMHMGGQRRLFIPYQLAYGEAGKPPVIPAKAELVFDVEVISQSDTRPAPPAPRPATPPTGSQGTTPPPGGASTPPPGSAKPQR